MAAEDQAARKALRQRARELPRIQRDTAAELRRLLSQANRDLRTQITGGRGSDFERWLNPQLRGSIRKTIVALGTEMGEAMVTGADRAWEAGVATVDGPIDAAVQVTDPQFRLAGRLASVDLRQLGAMREFLTHKMAGVSLEAVDRVNTALGLAATGVRSTGEVIADVQKVLGSTRKRAFTIVRTELGRAYSVAGQERMHQARAQLPALQKQWRRSSKLHSRIQHDAADGQIQDVDDPFQVSGIDLMFPRDPAAPAKETINCGCQSLPYMKSWEEAGALRDPRRRPFTDDEIAARTERTELGDPPSVRERVGNTPDAPVVVRGADPQPEHVLPGAAALHARTRKWVAWRQEVSPRGRQHETMAFGPIDPRVVAAARTHGMQIGRHDLTLSRAELAHLIRGDKHARGRAIEGADLDRLPAILARPERVLLDTADPERPALLYVFTPARGPRGRKGKVVVRPDFTASLRLPGEARRHSVTSASVRTAGYVQPEDLAVARYVPLDAE